MAHTLADWRKGMLAWVCEAHYMAVLGQTRTHTRTVATTAGYGTSPPLYMTSHRDPSSSTSGSRSPVGFVYMGVCVCDTIGMYTSATRLDSELVCASKPVYSVYNENTRTYKHKCTQSKPQKSGGIQIQLVFRSGCRGRI